MWKMMSSPTLTRLWWDALAIHRPVHPRCPAWHNCVRAPGALTANLQRCLLQLGCRTRGNPQPLEVFTVPEVFTVFTVFTRSFPVQNRQILGDLQGSTMTYSGWDNQLPSKNLTKAQQRVARRYPWQEDQQTSMLGHIKGPEMPEVSPSSRRFS